MTYQNTCIDVYGAVKKNRRQIPEQKRRLPSISLPLIMDPRKLKGRWVGGTEFLHLGLQIVSEAEAKK